MLPVPVGYPQERKVFIPPHLGQVKGNLLYTAFRGLTSRERIGHVSSIDGTWLTNWKSTDDQISWDIEVVKDGRYEVALNMRCPVAEAGSKVRVSIGNIHLDNSVPEAPLKAGNWKEVKWGTIPLQKGKYKLKVQATEVANEGAIVLGHVYHNKSELIENDK